MPFSGRKWFLTPLMVPGYLTRGAAEGAMAWSASKQMGGFLEIYLKISGLTFCLHFFFSAKTP